MLAACRSTLVEKAAWENEINKGTGEEISAGEREKRERETMSFHERQRCHINSS